MFVDDDVIGRVVNEQDGVATISLHHLHNDVIDSRTRVSSGLKSKDCCADGEVTSQTLWSRYDRHFVGITRHIALS